MKNKIQLHRTITRPKLFRTKTSARISRTKQILKYKEMKTLNGSDLSKRQRLVFFLQNMFAILKNSSNHIINFYILLFSVLK